MRRVLTARAVLLLAAGRRRRFDHGLQLRPAADDVKIDNHHFSSAIAAFGKTGRTPQALALLDEMQSRHEIEPNRRTLTVAIQACADAGWWRNQMWTVFRGLVRACRPLDDFARTHRLVDHVRGKSPFLIGCIVSLFDWNDVTLPWDVVVGVPLFGDIPTNGIMRPVAALASRGDAGGGAPSGERKAWCFFGRCGARASTPRSSHRSST